MDLIERQMTGASRGATLQDRGRRRSKHHRFSFMGKNPRRRRLFLQRTPSPRLNCARAGSERELSFDIWRAPSKGATSLRKVRASRAPRRSQFRPGQARELRSRAANGE